VSEVPTVVASEVTVPGRSRPRLDGLSLCIEPGITVVVGPNGSGKSTLLGALRGVVPLTGGAVTVEGRAIPRLSILERAGLFAWLPQTPRLEQGLTAEDAVIAARYRFGTSRAASREVAREALASVGASAWASASMATLSGGEAQRVRLATLVAQEAQIWLLDEPGAHLDPAVRLSLVDVLAAQRRAGVGLVVVTHDLAVLSRLGPEPVRVVGLREGRVAFHTSRDAPEFTEQLSDLLALELREVELEGRRTWLVVGPRCT
jgi:iron complex transport system ATP-binding protein